MAGQQKIAATNVGKLCDILDTALTTVLDLCPDQYLDPNRSFADDDHIANGWRASIEAIANALDVCEWHEVELRERVNMEPPYLCRNNLTNDYMPWE